MSKVKKNIDLKSLINTRPLQEKRDWMLEEYHRMHGDQRVRSPLTSTEVISTNTLLSYLSEYAGRRYSFSGFLRSRPETLVYKVNAKFRSDPYPGALAGIDYLLCREGKTFEERDKNLVMVWGNFQVANGEIVIEGGPGKSVDNFIEDVRRVSNQLLLGKSYDELEGYEIPRYFMQVRFGSTFSKVKHIRVYSHFCDAILFTDGVFWREG